ncbi:recombinase RecA [Myxococcota bacterium]|nr:recombinase RecA [Myxococcota bacterium]
MGLQDKMKIVRAAMQDIDKQFGKGAIMLLGSQESRLEEPVSVIPSGSIGLDRALGTGGLPRGRIVEIFGPESSGKTTLALHAIASVQREGGVAAFVDAEHALDPRYAAGLGLKLDELLVSQPDNGEQALEIVETLIRSSAVDVIVVDSVAALVPKAEIEGEMGDAHMGLQARLMSQAMRKLTALTAKTRTTIIFINQTRSKIGVVFGNPETTTGGNALKFYASIRLEIRRIGTVKEGETLVGSQVRVKVVKNKLAPPFREAEFEILYGKGVSTAGEVLDLGLAHALIEKSGAWYALGDTRIGQGRETARQWIEERPKLVERMRLALTKDPIDKSLLGAPDTWMDSEPEKVKGEAAKPTKVDAKDVKNDAKPEKVEPKDAKPEKVEPKDVKDTKPDVKDAKLDVKDAKSKVTELPLPPHAGNGASAGLKVAVGGRSATAR